MVQKIIGDKLVTENRQTDNRQTDNRQTFLSWPPSIWEILILIFFFFAYGRERTNGVKFIPPCLLRKFASLTCFARRGIKQTFYCLTWNIWNKLNKLPSSWTKSTSWAVGRLEDGRRWWGRSWPPRTRWWRQWWGRCRARFFERFSTSKVRSKDRRCPNPRPKTYEKNVLVF